MRLLNITWVFRPWMYNKKVWTCIVRTMNEEMHNISGIQTDDVLTMKSWHHSRQQSGAAEACWAHNPEVDGSKPSSARCFNAAQRTPRLLRITLSFV